MELSKESIIVFNPFVRRQTQDSHFTSWILNDEKFLEIIKDNIANGDYSPGYREGVILVHIKRDHPDFWTSVIELKDGDILVGKFSSRVEGEQPRKSIYLDRKCRQSIGKSEAKYVDVILYHHDVLALNDDQTEGSEWEIISVNGRISKEEQPIEPMTLMANHFEIDGGTPTNLSPEEFEKMLRKSFLYWKDKAFISPIV